MRIESGITTNVLVFVAVDKDDFTTRLIDLSSFTVYRSRNGNGPTLWTTPSITQLNPTNLPGVYNLLVDEDTTISSTSEEEEMVIHISQADMAPVTRTLDIFRVKITKGRTLDVTATGAGGIDWGNIENQGTTVDLSATDIQLCDTTTAVTNEVTADMTKISGDSAAADNLEAKNERVVVYVSTSGDPKTVIEARSAGDLVILGPGFHNVAADSIDIPDDVEVAGCGRDLTTLKGDLSASPFVRPGDRSLLRDITIENQWCYGLAGAASAVDCRIENCRIGSGPNTAAIDCVTFNTSTACSCTVRDTELFGQFDAIILLHATVVHELFLYNVDIFLAPGAANRTVAIYLKSAGAHILKGNNVNVIQEAGSVKCNAIDGCRIRP